MMSAQPNQTAGIPFGFSLTDAGFKQGQSRDAAQGGVSGRDQPVGVHSVMVNGQTEKVQGAGGGLSSRKHH